MKIGRLEMKLHEKKKKFSRLEVVEMETKSALKGIATLQNQVNSHLIDLEIIKKEVVFKNNTNNTVRVMRLANIEERIDKIEMTLKLLTEVLDKISK